MNAPAKHTEAQAPQTQIVEFNEFEANLAEYKARYEGMVYDLDDKDQNKQARSDRRAIGSTVAKLDEAHKDVKAPLAEKVALLDGERKRIKDGLREVQGGIDSQIKAHEAAAQKAEDDLIEKVEAIKNLANFADDPNSLELDMTIKLVESIEIDDSYGHHADNAIMARKTVVGQLKQRFADTLEHEEKMEELARLREENARLAAEKREQEIAANAAAEAERKTEIKAQREREEAKRAADVEREAAIAEAADNARIEAERKAEQERQATAQQAAARENDKSNRNEIHQAAARAIMEAGNLDIEQTRAVTQAIINGDIPAVSITY